MIYPQWLRGKGLYPDWLGIIAVVIAVWFITLRTKARHGMAEDFNIEIQQGDDFYWQITVQDASGTNLNLTGYTFRGQGRKKYSDTDAAFSFVCTPDANQTTRTGVLAVELSSAVTEDITAGGYKYDIEIVTAGGKVTKLYRGIATVKPEATK